MQVQWNQNAAPPSVNVVYPQTQNVMNPNSYPSATYSFTADFRSPNQSDPLITATSTFKPLQLQNTQKPNSNYQLFPQKSNFPQKSLGSNLKRSPSRIFLQEGQKDNQNMGNGYIFNHQGQIHPQEYGYTTCVNATAKVPVSIENYRDVLYFIYYNNSDNNYLLKSFFINFF